MPEFERDPQLARDLQDAIVKANVESASKSPAERKKARDDARREVLGKWRSKAKEAQEAAITVDSKAAPAKKPKPEPSNHTLEDAPDPVARNIASPAPLPGETLKPKKP